MWPVRGYMGASVLFVAADVVAAGLALAAGLWALAERRRTRAKERALAAAQASVFALDAQIGLDQAWTSAFEVSVLAVEEDRPQVVAGEETFAAAALALGVAAEPAAVLALLAEASASGPRVRALLERGEPFAVHVEGPCGRVEVEGRTSGAVAWLRLSLGAHQPAMTGAVPFSSVFDRQENPAWILGADGALMWANKAWLDAVEAKSLQDAAARALKLCAGVEVLVKAAVEGVGQTANLAWTTVKGQRRAFKIIAGPLPAGLVSVLALDVTEAEDTREAFKRHVAAHDETFNRLADAVAIFGPTRRLSFHNTAFTELWGLEPAWLADRPSHSEMLDRLRQSRRLPETDDYKRWKAAELAHYEDLGAAPDDLWTLPDGRTLRVVRQPHPFGGLLLLFSDVTNELKLRAQYNALIQVQQATLDKLNDAVAVFGSDGRLRLHNEAFERFWNVTPAQLAASADFDTVAELCLTRLHDQQFWTDLKARIGDPDPQARVAISGETRTSDKRIVVYQSRPLPDGATLIAFTDVTDTRDLERALADRSAALEEAERLKRDFVGNVSYELRTPLTTIIGYAELLDHASEGLSARALSHVQAVRQAAGQLARSIDDVLDVAQIDADEMALDLGDVALAELLDEAGGQWRRSAEEAEVKVDVKIDADAGVIRADRRRLGQVLDHLVENAVRQSPPGGVVTLSARRAQSEVQIQVSDTGRGIPFHVQAHIFDRFVGRDRGGPGLGLALVKALVELHGGWVDLESEPGKGATFTCHLPEVAQASAAQPELDLGQRRG